MEINKITSEEGKRPVKNDIKSSENWPSVLLGDCPTIGNNNSNFEDGIYNDSPSKVPSLFSNNVPSTNNFSNSNDLSGSNYYQNMNGFKNNYQSTYNSQNNFNSQNTNNLQSDHNYLQSDYQYNNSKIDYNNAESNYNNYQATSYNNPASKDKAFLLSATKIDYSNLNHSANKTDFLSKVGLYGSNKGGKESDEKENQENKMQLENIKTTRSGRVYDEKIDPTDPGFFGNMIIDNPDLILNKSSAFKSIIIGSVKNKSIGKASIGRSVGRSIGKSVGKSIGKTFDNSNWIANIDTQDIKFDKTGGSITRSGAVYNRTNRQNSEYKLDEEFLDQAKIAVSEFYEKKPVEQPKRKRLNSSFSTMTDDNLAAISPKQSKYDTNLPVPDNSQNIQNRHANAQLCTVFSSNENKQTTSLPIPISSRSMEKFSGLGMRSQTNMVGDSCSLNYNYLPRNYLQSSYSDQQNDSNNEFRLNGDYRVEQSSLGNMFVEDLLKTKIITPAVVNSLYVNPDDVWKNQGLIKPPIEPPSVKPYVNPDDVWNYDVRKDQRSIKPPIGPPSVKSKKGPFYCEIKDPETGLVCTKTFKRLDLLKRHEKIHDEKKSFQCPRCPYKCNRKDNLDNHMRIHFNSKPYICPYTTYNHNRNIWEPCLYAAARQDDLTKHCIGTAVCHLQEFTVDDYNNPELVPVKTMESKGKVKKFKLRQDNNKMTEDCYREYVNKNADFMYVIELKVMKKWTAIFNSAKKRKDQLTLDWLERRCIPNLLKGMVYDRPQDRVRVFNKPKFEFCDIQIQLDKLNFENLFKCVCVDLFEGCKNRDKGVKVAKCGGYKLGTKVKDTHNTPKVKVWEDNELENWKMRVDWSIRERTRNGR
jgi:hypothetical protein